MNEDSIVTVKDLTQAIMNSPNSKGMPERDAFDIARHVLNFFGYSDRIIDNVLEVDDRNMFYILEDATILTTEREETTLYDGREWRINYWLFRKDKIAKLISDDDSNKENEKEETIYDSIPDDAWN